MPLPQGFQLEQQAPSNLPEGFQLEGQAAQPKPKNKVHWGDAGSLLSAGDAYHAVNDWWDKTAYGAGGKVTDLATSMGASPQTSAGLGYGTNVAMQAGPALLGGKAVEKLAQPAMEGMGRYLMKSAVKPTLADQMSGDAAKGIETMLQQGYNPTKGGVEAMQAKIAQLGDEVTQAIANSTATVNKAAVGQRLTDAYNKFKAQVNPEGDLKAIRQAWDEFKNHPDLVGKMDMPVQLAQALKQGTYRVLGSKPYGEVGGAATEAQKQLARGLKEEVSAAVPGVSKANTAQAELINAKEIAERRALMEGNKNPVSLGASLGAVMQNPMATLGLWANSSAFAKSMMARMLYSGSPVAGAAAGTGAVAASGTGRAPSEEEMLAEALRKQKPKQPIPQPQPMMSPEDASIPLAYR